MADTTDSPDQRLEEIVAYLDGELSAGERARVEQRLAADETYRRQLQSAQQVWDALDELPLTLVDDRFSRTTMEMAVQDAAADFQAKTLALPTIARRRRTTTLLAAAAGLALGFLGIRLAWPDPNRMLSDDLPVIAGIDAYTQFQDAAFLRNLAERAGRQLAATGPKAEEITARAAMLVAVERASDRDRWLSALSPSEQVELRAKYNRFRDLPGREQDRLRALHKDVAEAPDANGLRRTMVEYQQWLGGLSPEQQYELRTLPRGERIAAIVDWAARMQDEQALTLTDAELLAFSRGVRGPLDEMRGEFFRAMRDNSRGDRPGRGGPPGRQEFGGLRRTVAAQFGANQGEQQGPGSDDRPLQAAVAAALPERVRAPFMELPQKQKVDRVMLWLRQASALQGRVSQAELERFFAEDLDVRTRTRLLTLPAGQMHERLLALYRQQPGMDFDRLRGWGPGDRRGPRGPGGPGGRDDFRGGGRGPGPAEGFGGRGDAAGGFGPPGGFGPRDGGGFGPPRQRRPPPPPPVDDGFRPRRDFGDPADVPPRPDEPR